MPATSAHKAASAQALAQSFSVWLSDSALPNPQVPRTAPFFSTHQTGIFLDTASAVQLIRTGLRAGNVGALVPLLGLRKKDDLSHALNANSTSLWRWARDDKPLPGSTVEQILRAMDLQLFAADVFGSVEAAREWLQKPHTGLDGLPPSDYADNAFGVQKVRGMLAGLKYGGVA